MGKLNCFLGLKVKQTTSGTIIHQQKYVKEILKRFAMEEAKDISTLIATATKLDLDETGPDVEQKSKFPKLEVYEFYNNGVAIGEMFSTIFRGVTMNLYVADITRILHIPSGGWGQFVKGTWPRLDNLASTLDICRKFFGNPHLINHRRVLKREMSPLHQLYFDVVHKMISPRKERTVPSILDLTLMELLDTEVKIDFSGLILEHMQRILLKEVNRHTPLTNSVSLLYLRILGCLSECSLHRLPRIS
ncbi:putative cysteine-rich receptor-like protein kinase 29-like isoform X1 [Capsicum annuum]|nr:putative cysteine-rich receptor-like protein kinase 29-like isoform X1 [Capsicum annuum]